MSLQILDSVRTCNPTRGLLPSKNPISPIPSGAGNVSDHHPLQSTTILNNSSTDSITVRRSADYRPTIWSYDYIQSLRSEYGESCTKQVIEKLKEEVRMMFKEGVDPLKKLELIDVLQRLGLSYHFEDEIKSILESIYNTTHGGGDMRKESLYATSLGFRLLRQNGYNVPQEIFNSFKDEKGSFLTRLCDDIEGMLGLYEASFLLIDGEGILEEARDFSIKHLTGYLEKSKDQNLSAMVSHALELPLHWRMLRLETRWYIDVYRSKEGMNPLLLKLAELDFNVVQAAHQEDLKQASRWWKSTGLEETLTFARDRLMENFFWTVGVIFQPNFGYCRRMLTKLITLMTIIDDVYDVYGSLEELELFTDAIERWDTNAMDRLPYYMKICFLTLHNAVNEMAFDVLKEQGFHIIRYLKKVMVDLCRSFMLEAKWFYTGYKPSFQEYIENAWISIAAPVVLVHAYFLVTNPITTEALECLEGYPDIIRWSSLLVRLTDDLGTSKDELKRGDVPKSIQCYMNETGVDVDEDDAREYIRSLISATWKKMNKEQLILTSPLSKIYVESAINLARMAQCTYQHGDGHGVQDGDTKDRILSLLVRPIPIDKDH
ncbi:hypothetical protein F2P56_035054 [Juglans regia]|uniref:Myrcene synthase, chloroplastic-like n=2 Tax=Juglans regia TaxID=51240 RepID=A0A2I4H0T9_JUGRE|nr:myrcene synthase, chloroplastic-like [Juglans regia]KAF5442391.1 hypothetical protein F2P56_035054 [Juglans regia]